MLGTVITEAENCHGSVTTTRGVSMISKFGVPPLLVGMDYVISSYLQKFPKIGKFWYDGIEPIISQIVKLYLSI